MSTLIDLMLTFVERISHWRFWIPVVASASAFLVNYHRPGQLWPWFISVPILVLGFAVGSWWQYVWHNDKD